MSCCRMKRKLHRTTPKSDIPSLVYLTSQLRSAHLNHYLQSALEQDCSIRMEMTLYVLTLDNPSKVGLKNTRDDERDIFTVL